LSSIAISLDIIRLVASVALTYFVFFLYQKVFRAGVMEKGFRMIAISILILTIGRSLDFIAVFQPNNDIASISTTVLGTAFTLVATYGFYLLYIVWRVDKREYVTETKPIIA